jgi:WhiB family transcriptional regulator, redox-sensing transcriptional regulator
MIVNATGWEHEPTPWVQHAACHGSPPDLWFPARGDTTIQAKAICRQCPVRAECLAYALRWHIGFGIWGGLSERERRLLGPTPKPRRLAAPHGTTTSYARGCRCTECRMANGQAALSRRGNP